MRTVGHLVVAMGAIGALVASAFSTSAAGVSFRGHNGRIVFVADSPAGRDIFTVRPDGTGKRRLTDFGHVRDPRFNATGRRIAFTRVGRSKNVWIMRADGSRQRPVIVGPAQQSQPSWSPDGEWIAFTSNRSGRRQIHLYEIATGESRRITTAGRTLRAAWAPAWSPDGQRIAFVARIKARPQGEFGETYWDVVMTVGVDGGEPTQLVDEGFAQRPDWTPSGRTLLFAYQGPSSRDICSSHTYRIAGDGSEDGPTPVATHGCFQSDPVRSPNGRRMALWSTGPDPVDPDPQMGLHVARADGSHERVIATGVRSELGIDWQRR